MLRSVKNYFQRTRDLLFKDTKGLPDHELRHFLQENRYLRDTMMASSDRNHMIGAGAVVAYAALAATPLLPFTGVIAAGVYAASFVTSVVGETALGMFAKKREREIVAELTSRPDFEQKEMAFRMAQPGYLAQQAAAAMDKKLGITTVHIANAVINVPKREK